MNIIEFNEDNLTLNEINKTTRNEKRKQFDREILLVLDEYKKI